MIKKTRPILLFIALMGISGCDNPFEVRPLTYTIDKQVNYYGNPFITTHLSITNHLEGNQFINEVELTMENQTNITYTSLEFNCRFYDGDSNRLIAEKRHIYTNLAPGVSTDTLHYTITSPQPITATSIYATVLDILPTTPSALTNVSGGYNGATIVYTNAGDFTYYQFSGNISIDGNVHLTIFNQPYLQYFEGVMIYPTLLTGQLFSNRTTAFSPISVDSISFVASPYYLKVKLSDTINAGDIKEVAFILYND